eukprot:jgi/Tetstr1/442147/TSEL_030300.t1
MIPMAPAGVNKWRLIIDVRPLSNRYFEERDPRFEILTQLRHLPRPGDSMFPMDLHDGFYAIGIAPEARDHFTVDCRGKVYRLAGLPMGWGLSPCCFSSLTAVFNSHMRRPDFTIASHGVRRSKLSIGRRQALRSHFRG